MEPPIIPFDIARMLMGDEPPLFLAEIVVRVIVIYTYTLVLLRWIGGRSIAQLSIVEFLLVIALGSAVGDALFYPDVPLLHAMLVVTVVVGLDKVIDLAIRRFRPVKRFVDGSPVEVIRDGRVLTDGLMDRELGVAELMERLRLRGFENLGQVRRAYVEASGQLSIYAADPPQPGLRVMPPTELAPHAPPATGEAACCTGCGLVTDVPAACPACGCGERTGARTGPPCKAA